MKRLLQCAAAVLPPIVLAIVITGACRPALQSGDKLLLNSDFFQYASRHEAVRKSLLELHTFPLRSHWFGGGYPTLGDPEDPTLNPLVLFSVACGTVMGLKVIGYVAMLIGGLATYALGRYVLGYTAWGALFSGLVYGLCLFIPLRLLDGNPNEVYAGFLPVGLLLIGLACQRRKWAIVLAPFVFLTMLSDGKLNALMAIFFIGVLCVATLLPGLRALAPAPAADSPRWRVDYRPLKFFLLAMGLTALIGLPRILPARELVNSHGGIQQMLSFHPKTYQPGAIRAYSFEHLWKEACGLEKRTGYATVGLLPVVLAGIALLAFWRNLLAWGVALVLFGWLAMAHHAAPDLLKLSWKLPVFEAIYRPDKYFTFPIAFTIAVAAGAAVSLLRQLRSRWVETVIALVLIAFAVGFLYPKTERIQRTTYTSAPPKLDPPPADGFYHVEGHPLVRVRFQPPNALAYFNLRRNLGTIDWYTGIPIPEKAIPRFFVGADNQFRPNPAYRGEAWFLDEETGTVTAPPVFRPNSIRIGVDVRSACTVILNQNYHRDWRANHGHLFEQEGRLALQLDDPGQYALRLRYHPRSFYAGLAVAIPTLLIVAWTCWAYRTGRLRQWAGHRAAVPGRASQLLLGLIE